MAEQDPNVNTSGLVTRSGPTSYTELFWLKNIYLALTGGSSVTPPVTPPSVSNATIGTTADPAVDDYSNNSATATLDALIKGWLKGLGTIADAAWSSGNGTVIGLLKAIATSVAATGAVIINAAKTAAGSGTLVSVVCAATNNATSLKGSAGQLYAVSGSNVAAYPVYVKFYNKASAPSPGSDTPVLVCTIPAAATAANGMAMPPQIPSTGFYFSVGIAYAIVKGIGAADNTAVAAADCVVNFEYL